MSLLGLLRIAGVMSPCVVLVWTTAGMALKTGEAFSARRRLTLARCVHAELKPFYLPAAVLAYLDATLAHGPLTHWGAVVHSMGLFLDLLNWYLFRDASDDDDRWKRRRRKLAEKVVRAANGGLTVVPESP